MSACTRMMFVRFLSVLSVIALVAGCGKKNDAASTPHGANVAAPEKVVGVNQYVQHPILDAVLKGLQDRLSTEPGVRVVVKNSNGDALSCQQINEQFVQSKVAVLVALGTPAAQSAVNVAGDTPVVFGAITDPVGAKLADTLQRPGGKKTGTTNRWPFEDQVALVRKAMPTAKRLGLVVNPGEANCEAGMAVIRAEAKKAGLEVVEAPVANSSEVRAAVESLRGKVDVMLISPANTVFSALDTLLGVAKESGIPVFGGDESAVTRGSIATYGFSNAEVGRETAEVVLRVLQGKVPPGEIPVARPPTAKLYVNATAAAAAGVKLTTEEEAVSR